MRLRTEFYAKGLLVLGGEFKVSEITGDLITAPYSGIRSLALGNPSLTNADVTTEVTTIVTATMATMATTVGAGMDLSAQPLSVLDARLLRLAAVDMSAILHTWEPTRKFLSCLPNRAPPPRTPCTLPPSTS